MFDLTRILRIHELSFHVTLSTTKIKERRWFETNRRVSGGWFGYSSIGTLCLWGRRECIVVLWII